MCVCVCVRVQEYTPPRPKLRFGDYIIFLRLSFSFFPFNFLRRLRRRILLWSRRHCCEAQYTLIITAYIIVDKRVYVVRLHTGRTKTTQTTRSAEHIISDPSTAPMTKIIYYNRKSVFVRLLSV
jgi:hypothetical protein